MQTTKLPETNPSYKWNFLLPEFSEATIEGFFHECPQFNYRKPNIIREEIWKWIQCKSNKNGKPDTVDNLCGIECITGLDPTSISKNNRSSTLCKRKNITGRKFWDSGYPKKLMDLALKKHETHQYTFNIIAEEYYDKFIVFINQKNETESTSFTKNDLRVLLKNTSYRRKRKKEQIKTKKRTKNK